MASSLITRISPRRRPGERIRESKPVAGVLTTWRVAVDPAGSRRSNVERAQRMLRQRRAGGPDDGSEAGRREQQRRRCIGEKIEAADAEDVMAQEPRHQERTRETAADPGAKQPGALAGLVLTTMLGAYMASLVKDASPDPALTAVALAIIGILAAAAIWTATRHISRLDITEVLRAETAD